MCLKETMFRVIIFAIRKKYTEDPVMKKIGTLGMTLALFTMIGALSFTASNQGVHASDNGAVFNSVEVDTDATELSSDDLSIKITQSTYTSNSQYYNINFSTSYTLYKAGRQYNILYEITDSEFDPENLPKRPEDNPETPDVNENDEYVMPVFEGVVYSIENATNTSIVIPNYVTVNKNFQIKVTKIPSNVFSAKFKDSAIKKIESIYLPETVESVGDDAFARLTDAAKIYVPIQNSEAPIHFGENWAPYPTNVVYDFDYSDSANASVVDLGTKNSNSSGTVAISNSTSFSIGYEDLENPENSKPLIISYDVDNGSTIETRTQELPVTGDINPYEVVGTIGVKNYTKVVSLILNEGETVIDDSIVLYNIYKAEMVPNPNGSGNIILPVGEQYKSSPRIAYAARLSINDFLDYEFTHLGTFFDFTSITLKLNCKDQVYKDNKTAAYEKEAKNIANGKTYIRYRFDNLNSTYYNVTYIGNDGKTYNERAKLVAAAGTTVVGKIGENTFTFLLDNKIFSHGLTAQSIRGICIDDLNIKVDLFTETGKASNGSTLSATFASIMVVNPATTTTTLNTYDLNFVCLLSLIIFLVVYSGGTVALFFINKERFKNDEFKRVVPAKFFKRAAIIGVGLMIIMYALLFIISRFGIMANTIVVFNPIDIPIIIFTVLAILFIGYFIKELVTEYKTHKQNKERVRLNLDADKVDDGTN